MYNKYLQRIANIICLNLQHIEEAGLIYGHLGIVMFLYYYSRYSNQKEYEQHADDLLGFYIDQVAANTDTSSFSDGTYGIGWAIKYMSRNGFIEIDQETLSDYDLVASYEWSENETVEDFENFISLFSKGLYCSDMENDYFVRNTINVLKKTIEKVKADTYKLTYLNSCLYFLAKCKTENKYIGECKSILNNLSMIIDQCIDKEDYSTQDIYIFNRLAAIIDLNIRIPEVKIDLLNDVFLNWQTIVYEDLIDLDGIVSSSLLERYIDEKTITSYNKNLSLNGLAALGINIIKYLEEITN